jgi:hypothetical protein
MISSSKCLWYRIVSMPTPRVATTNASYGEPETFEHSMLFKGLDGIVGAGGGKAAFRWAEHGRKDPLIQLDESNKRKGQYSK